MDIFSVYIPRPVFINSLPSASIFGIPLGLVFYLITALILVLFFFKAEKETLGKIIIGAWFSISLLFLVQSGIQSYTESMIFKGKSLDELRDITTPNGFYPFLLFAQKNIPPKSSVSLYLPENSDTQRYKAPYYLYPHPVISEGEYILAFHSDIKLEKGQGELVLGDKTIKVELVSEFKENEYILKRI